MLQEGRPAEALPHLQEAIRLQGAGVSTMMQIAVAYDMLGRFDEEERALSDLMRETTTLPDSHALLASVLLRRKQLDRAEQELDVALTMAPELPSAWIVAGQLAEAKGETDRALAAYAHAVARSPSARYHAMYAAAAARAGRSDLAKAEARRCLEREPARPDCRKLLEAP